MNRFEFLKESLKNIKTIGTFTRSSRRLCHEMVKHGKLSEAKVVVELGAGDGVLTQFILNALPKDAILFSFEVHESFCKLLRQIDDPRLIVCEASAEDMIPILEAAGYTEVDSILSAIPFVMIPDDVGQFILKSSEKLLKKGRPYVQIHYSILRKKWYQEIFGNVELHFVPMNIPPTFIHVCIKQ
ncbi:MAG: ribose ABC transporter permease [Saprospiraceae bacterium]